MGIRMCKTPSSSYYKLRPCRDHIAPRLPNPTRQAAVRNSYGLCPRPPAHHDHVGTPPGAPSNNPGQNDDSRRAPRSPPPVQRPGRRRRPGRPPICSSAHRPRGQADEEDPSGSEDRRAGRRPPYRRLLAPDRPRAAPPLHDRPASGRDRSRLHLPIRSSPPCSTCRT